MFSLLVALPGVSGSTVNPTCAIQWFGEFFAQKTQVEVFLPDVFCDTTAYPDDLSIATRLMDTVSFTTSTDCSESDLEAFARGLAYGTFLVRADERLCNPPPTDLLVVYRDLLVYAGQDLYTTGSSTLLEILYGFLGGSVNPVCVVQWFGEFFAQKTRVEVFLPDIFCDPIAFPDNVSIAARTLEDLTFLTSPECPQSDLEAFWLQFTINVVNNRVDERMCNPPPTDLFLVYRDLLVYAGQDLLASGGNLLGALYDGHDHSDHGDLLGNLLGGHDHSDHAGYDDDHYADGHTHDGDKSFAFETSVVVSLVALAIRVL